MNRALGDVDKNGDGSTQIQQGMHLYGTFLVVELSPGIQAKAQVNGRTVKSIDHIIEVNPKIIVFDIQRSCLFDKCLSKVGINTPVSFLVGICKS